MKLDWKEEHWQNQAGHVETGLRKTPSAGIYHPGTAIRIAVTHIPEAGPEGD